MGNHDRPQTTKSVLINMWSTLTIVLPIFIIVRFDLLWDLLMVWAAATSIMMVVPPVGWIRPHPYSDFVWNRRRSRAD
ncbi:unnamed protein product [Ectocarpus sp. CCAP 1310/34]|nr:unnamed protein product [Ectocarpus sp. CCAP 1310/34]